jgi:hypothetical protein
VNTKEEASGNRIFFSFNLFFTFDPLLASKQMDHYFAFIPCIFDIGKVGNAE